MATTNLIFGPIGGQSNEVGRPPVISIRASENIAPTGTSQQSAAAAPERNGGFEAVQITTDTNIYVAQGTNPTAGVADGLILAGQTRDFFLVKGEKIAVITATL